MIREKEEEVIDTKVTPGHNMRSRTAGTVVTDKIQIFRRETDTDASKFLPKQNFKADSRPT